MSNKMIQLLEQIIHLSNLSSVVQCGAKPIIVEVENETLGLDFIQLKKQLGL